VVGVSFDPFEQMAYNAALAHQDADRARDSVEAMVAQMDNLARQRDAARESQAQLEEENALLLWLYAEAVWLRSWRPRQGERVTSKSRGKYDPDPVGEFDGFIYEGTTAIIRHVPPRHPGVVVDRTYVDAHTLRPAGTEPATSKAEPEKWEPTLGERVKGAAAGSDRWVTGPYHGGFWSMFEGRAMARIGDEGDPGLAADWMVFADSLRPAPTEPEGRHIDDVVTREGLRIWHKGDPEPKYVASVRDADGDVWTRDHRGVWRTPDHGPCGWGYVANRWGPLAEVVDTFIAEDVAASRMADASDMETHGGES
jgi:hypothetical protein